MTRATIDPIAARLSRARTTLVMDQPFFGALALRLGMVPDPTCPTAATDARSIFYRPDYLAGLTDRQVVGLLAHEVLHVALGHCWRRDARDPRRWNMACDHAINPLVRAAGLDLPPDGLSDPVPAYPGQCAEAIYRHLPEPDPSDDGDDRNGAGTPSAPDPSAGDFGPGAVRDFPGTPAQAAAAQAELRAAVIAAAQQARQHGHLPAALAGAIEEALAPVVDWPALLRRFVQTAAGRDDYGFRLPNPGYTHLGIYLPALVGERCGELAVMIDTSGSVSDTELGQFAAEVTGIHADLAPAALHVLWADAALGRVDRYGPDEPPDFTQGAPGRGGTDFRPAFDWLAARERPPVAAIYLTDGAGTYPLEPPDYPVLWVLLPGGDTPPWGEIVRMDLIGEGAP